MKSTLFILITAAIVFSSTPPTSVVARSYVNIPIWYVNSNPYVFIVIDYTGTAVWLKTSRTGKIIQEHKLFNGKTIDNTVDIVRTTLTPTPFKEELYGSY